MASSRTETGITWSSAASIALSSATAVVSDLTAYNVEDWDAEIGVTALNGGTPASGDIVTVQIAYSVGNIDGSAGDDYSTTKGAEYLGQLNTFATDANGENPQMKTWPIRTGAKGFKLIVIAPQGASRTITVRAGVITHKPQ